MKPCWPLCTSQVTNLQLLWDLFCVLNCWLVHCYEIWWLVWLLTFSFTGNHDLARAKITVSLGWFSMVTLITRLCKPILLIGSYLLISLKCEIALEVLCVCAWGSKSRLMDSAHIWSFDLLNFASRSCFDISFLFGSWVPDCYLVFIARSRTVVSKCYYVPLH